MVLSSVALDGQMINRYGTTTANFLEIGGEAYTLGQAALELVLSHPNIKTLLVNFCGAFARTDVMTEGIIEAANTETQSPRLFHDSRHR